MPLSFAHARMSLLWPRLAVARPDRRRWPLPASGMFDEGCGLLTERPGVLLVQVDLVLRAVHPEPQGLVCRAAVKIIF
jgi:hypothetical protein